MKTPIGTEVDLGPGHIVLRQGPSFPSAKGAQRPPLCSTHGRPSQLLLSSC